MCVVALSFLMFQPALNEADGRRRVELMIILSHFWVMKSTTELSQRCDPRD